MHRARVAVVATGAGIVEPLLLLLALTNMAVAVVVAMAVAAMAAGLVVMGATSSPWPAGAALAALAFFEEVWNVVSVTYRQSRTPDEMLGRVMSSFRVIAYGAFPLGALAGGLIAQASTVRLPFFVGAAVMAILVPAVSATMGEDALAPR